MGSKSDGDDGGMGMKSHWAFSGLELEYLWSRDGTRHQILLSPLPLVRNQCVQMAGKWLISFVRRFDLLSLLRQYSYM